MKSSFITITCIIGLIFYSHVMLFAVTADETGDTPKEPTAINLAFFYKDTESRIKTISLDDTPVTLNAGDKLKVYYEPVSKVYFYIFTRDAGKNISLIFPDDMNFHYQEGAAYYIPQGKLGSDPIYWMTLVDKGPDVFYFIASVEKLTTLESLMRHYRDSGEKKARNKVYKQLEQLYMIANERNAGESVLQKSLEKPEIISGTVKNIIGDIQYITVRDLYVKKIIINH